METSISREQLSKVNLFIASPMFGGLCHGRFMLSCMNLQERLQQAGVSHSFVHIYHESLIPRARNKMAAKFLDGSIKTPTGEVPYTHILYLDADISFTADDILFMIALDKDVIAAPYAKKSVDWSRVKEAVQNNPEIPVEQLAKVGCSYVNGFLNNGEIRLDQPVEVREVGTGVLLCKRVVFERMIQGFPKMQYEPMAGEEQIPTYDFFGTGTYKGGKNYLSEDYYFNARWRDLGGSVWLCPWMITTHIGSYDYVTDIATTAQYLRSI